MMLFEIGSMYYFRHLCWRNPVKRNANFFEKIFFHVSVLSSMTKMGKHSFDWIRMRNAVRLSTHSSYFVAKLIIVIMIFRISGKSPLNLKLRCRIKRSLSNKWLFFKWISRKHQLLCINKIANENTSISSFDEFSAEIP